MAHSIALWSRRERPFLVEADTKTNSKDAVVLYNKPGQHHKQSERTAWLLRLGLIGGFSILLLLAAIHYRMQVPMASNLTSESGCPDLYAVVGISPTASQDVIKAGFARRIREWRQNKDRRDEEEDEGEEARILRRGQDQQRAGTNTVRDGNLHTMTTMTAQQQQHSVHWTGSGHGHDPKAKVNAGDSTPQRINMWQLYCAVQTLSDPARRREYDDALQNGDRVRECCPCSHVS